MSGRGDCSGWKHTHMVISPRQSALCSYVFPLPPDPDDTHAPSTTVCGIFWVSACCRRELGVGVRNSGLDGVLFLQLSVCDLDQDL